MMAFLLIFIVLLGCCSFAVAFHHAPTLHVKKNKRWMFMPSSSRAFSGAAIQSSTYWNDEPEQQLSLVVKVWKLYQNSPEPTQYDAMITSIFPGALANKDLETRVVEVLSEKGYTDTNTLLATSLCCDELARRLEDDFVYCYGNNFSLGGLSGFPFGGSTGFENMALHIPDNGSCLIVYGPHVGVSSTGIVGKVERVGTQNVDVCCASAIAACNYLQGITDDGIGESQAFTDLQQGAVQQLLSPNINQVSASKDPMVELPYALYDSQDSLLYEIVMEGCHRVKNNIALLGGIQINTAPQALDYFLPLRFDLMNNRGEVIEDMLNRIR